MTKIDWYILKRFLGTFFYAIMILTIISVVIDITEKMDDFISNHLSVPFIVAHYYLAFIPYIIALLFPLFVFIAVIFFTSKMAYRLEVMAILSSGVSFWRFLRPFWVGGAFLALLLGVANQGVIPHANKTRIKFENRYTTSYNPDKSNTLTNVHVRVDSFDYISMNAFYIDDNYASGFTMERIKGQQLLSKLEAPSITWDSAQKVWKTGRAVIRFMDGMSVPVKVVSDTTLHLNITPQDIEVNTDAQVSMSTKELNHYIARQELRGAGGLNYLYVEKYRRTSSAFAVLILTFIGAIIASRKVRGGSGLHLALGIVLSAAYILFMQFSTTFSVKGTLNPLLAVWIPNILFGGIALWLYKKAPK